MRIRLGVVADMRGGQPLHVEKVADVAAIRCVDEAIRTVRLCDRARSQALKRPIGQATKRLCCWAFEHSSIRAATRSNIRPVAHATLISTLPTVRGTEIIGSLKRAAARSTKARTLPGRNSRPGYTSDIVTPSLAIR